MQRFFPLLVYRLQKNASSNISVRSAGGGVMKYILPAMATLIVFLFGVTIFRNISPGTIFNPDAIIIILGGTIIAVLIGFPLKRIRQSIADVRDAFADDRDRDSVVREIMAIARVYRSLTNDLPAE